MRFLSRITPRASQRVSVVSATLTALLALAGTVRAERIGRVSGAFGDARLQGQQIGIADPVNNGDKIETGATGAAAVLLQSNAVVKIDGNTVVTVTEEQGRTVLK